MGFCEYLLHEFLSWEAGVPFQEFVIEGQSFLWGACFEIAYVIVQITHKIGKFLIIKKYCALSLPKFYHRYVIKPRIFFNFWGSPRYFTFVEFLKINSWIRCGKNREFLQTIVGKYRLFHQISQKRIVIFFNRSLKEITNFTN